jgi:hypothetical protein
MIWAAMSRRSDTVSTKVPMALISGVTPRRIECAVDGELVVDQDIENRRISVRNEVSASKPLGIATYATVGEARNIRWRPLPRP